MHYAATGVVEAAGVRPAVWAESVSHVCIRRTVLSSELNAKTQSSNQIEYEIELLSLFILLSVSL